MKATNNGSLVTLPAMSIFIPGAGTISLKSLPDISDSKAAVYNNEAIIGRSFPLYTYSHSGDRNLSIQLHFFVVDPADAATNLGYLRMIQSAVYPREGSPFLPPPVCQITFGYLLAGNPSGAAPTPLCCVLQSYSVKFPTEVAWQEQTFCPFRFDVDTSWLVVYTSSDLPYQSRIVTSGR
jgi:hypothetical protein